MSTWGDRSSQRRTGIDVAPRPGIDVAPRPGKVAPGLVAAYPGTFDPPTIAHLAIAEAARRHDHLARVDLVVSDRPLGKKHLARSTSARLEALRSLQPGRPWLGVRRTAARLLVDVAAGYDVVVLGADKWQQLLDPSWYGGSLQARDAALARLPCIRVAPRPPFELPEADPPRLEILRVASKHALVSSSAVRAGRVEWAARPCADGQGNGGELG